MPVILASFVSWTLTYDGTTDLQCWLDGSSQSLYTVRQETPKTREGFLSTPFMGFKNMKTSEEVKQSSCSSASPAYHEKVIGKGGEWFGLKEG